MHLSTSAATSMPHRVIKRSSPSPPSEGEQPPSPPSVNENDLAEVRKELVASRAITEALELQEARLELEAAEKELAVQKEKIERLKEKQRRPTVAAGAGDCERQGGDRVSVTDQLPLPDFAMVKESAVDRIRRRLRAAKDCSSAPKVEERAGVGVVQWRQTARKRSRGRTGECSSS